MSWPSLGLGLLLLPHFLGSDMLNLSFPSPDKRTEEPLGHLSPVTSTAP